MDTLCFPESCRLPGARPHWNWAPGNPVGALTFLRERQNLLGLMSIYVLYLFAHNVFPASSFSMLVTVSAGDRSRRGHAHRHGSGHILVQTLVVGRVVKAIGGAAERSLIGFGSAVLAFIMYALAFNCRLVLRQRSGRRARPR